jgi:hypothetical protein
LCNYEYISNPSLEHKRSPPIKLLPKGVNGFTRPNPTTFKSKGGLSVVNSNKPSTKTSSTQFKSVTTKFQSSSTLNIEKKKPKQNNKENEKNKTRKLTRSKLFIYELLVIETLKKLLCQFF